MKSPHPAGARPHVSAPRPFTVLARGLLLAGLALVSAASLSADVSRAAVSANWLYGGATADVTNNHVITNPANSTRDILKFDNVNFGDGYDTVEIELRIAYGSGGQRIDVRADDKDGAIIGTLYADATGNTGADYRLQTASLNGSVTGVRHLYLTIEDTPGLAPIRLRNITLRNRGPLSTFLKQNGIYLRNHYGQGDIVRLYGVNLGGWAIQEPWMSPLAFSSATPDTERDQKGAIDILTGRFDPATAKNILDTFYEHYITAGDFDRIAAENLNCIRLPIYWQDYMDEWGNFYVHEGQIDFRRIEAVVEEAKKRGIYVVIDLHGAQGSQNGRDHSGDKLAKTTTAGLWTSSTKRENTKKLWREIARRFRSEPAVAGYDVLNEAAWNGGAKQWNADIRAFVRELYFTIREVDPDHVIFFDVWSEYDHVGTLTTGLENIALSYHWYVYDAFLKGPDETLGTADDRPEHDFWLKSGEGRIPHHSVQSRENYAFPVWVGEFSFKDYDNSNIPATIQRWTQRMNAMTRHGLSWTKWSYKVRVDSNRLPGWGMYETTSSDDRLWVDDPNVEASHLLNRAEKWGTSGKFTKNTIVADMMKNAVAIFGAPARPVVAGPIDGLTKDIPDHSRHGVTLGGQGWANFSPGDYVTLPNVDFGAAHDRFFAYAHVAAVLGSGEAGGQLEIRLDSPTGTLLGTVTLNSTGVSSALLQRRPVGMRNIVLVAKRPGASSPDIGLIKRVFFSEPPVVSLLNKESGKYASLQPGNNSLATTASAAGDREDYFLLTTTSDPLGASSFTTALLSRKTMKWVGVDSSDGNLLKATVAYNNASGAPTISAQRAAAPQFVIATTGDGAYRSIKAVSNNLYARVDDGDGPILANHNGAIGSFEKFELVPHLH